MSLLCLLLVPLFVIAGVSGQLLALSLAVLTGIYKLDLGNGEMTQKDTNSNSIKK